MNFHWDETGGGNQFGGRSMAALTARPSASALRPVITAAAPAVVVAVVAAAVVPPVEVAAVAVATRRTLVGSRIGSRIGKYYNVLKSSHRGIPT